MLERHVLTIAAGYLDDARVRVQRKRRGGRGAAHVWVTRGDVSECRWCATRPEWSGARHGCGNASEARKRARDEAGRERKARKVGA